MLVHYQHCGEESWDVARAPGRSACTQGHPGMAGGFLELTLGLIEVLICTSLVSVPF